MKRIQISVLTVLMALTLCMATAMGQGNTLAQSGLNPQPTVAVEDKQALPEQADKYSVLIGNVAWAYNPDDAYTALYMELGQPVNAILYNGAQVIVRGIRWEDESTPWACVSIGSTSEDGLFSALMPATCLTSEQPTVQMPTAIATDQLSLDSANGHLSVGDLYTGQRVTLIGRENARWFIQTETEQGSMLLWDIAPEDEWTSFIATKKPDTFVQTGLEFLTLRDERDALDVKAFKAGGWVNMSETDVARYKELCIFMGEGLEAFEDTLANNAAQGSPDMVALSERERELGVGFLFWTLEQKAEFARDNANILTGSYYANMAMPSQTDITPERATQIAQEAIMSEYGLSLEEMDRFHTNLLYHTESGTNESDDSLTNSYMVEFYEIDMADPYEYLYTVHINPSDGTVTAIIDPTKANG